MTKALFLIPLLILAASVQADCTIGCRSCGADRTCSFCDRESGYILQAGTCIQVKIPNCTEITDTGACGTCTTGNYPDANGGVCVVVKTFVDNCELYSADATCSRCKKGYAILNAKCVTVSASVANCLEYDAAGNCTACNSGFVPSSDGQSCMSDPLLSNCATYRNLSCNKCRADYVLNSNNYFNLYYGLNNSTHSGAIIDMMDASSRNRHYSDLPGPCQALQMTNCRVPITYNTCSVCESGYYLDTTGQCQANPSPALANCDSYSDNSTCVNCTKGFYAKGGLCVANSEIKNCLTFATAGDKTKCNECEAGYYITDNNCVPRDKSTNIANCEKVSPISDQCGFCTYGFSLTTNGQFCLKSVPNCAEYVDSVGDASTPLACKTCTPNYYYDAVSKQCVKGTVTDCLTYDKTSNTCTACNLGFYLLNGKCYKQTPISACSVYSPTEASTCTTCETNHVQISSQQVCRPTANIPNCEQFSSYNQCAKCKDLYRLSNNTCVGINPVENCLQKARTGACTKCQPQYVLNKRGRCEMVQEFQTDSCIQYSQIGTETSFACQLCDYNYFPVDYTDNFTCMSSYNLVYTIPDCLKQTIGADGEYYCSACDNGLVISSDRKTCVPTCGQDEMLLVSFYDPNDYDLTVMSVTNMISNLCMPANMSIDYCKVATTIENYVYRCLQCADGAIPVMTDDFTAEYSLFDASTTPISAPASLGFASLATQCTVPYSINTTYYPGNTKPSPNCEYYKQYSDHFLCKKCIFGKTGPMVSGIFGGSASTYVDCSYDVTNCDVSNVAKYGGLHLENSAFRNLNIISMFDFTCYKCNSVTQIPVIHTVSTKSNHSAERLSPYALVSGSDAPNTADSANGYHTVCRSMNSSDLAIPSAKFTAKWIANCGLAWYNTGIAKDYTDPNADTASVQCLECKPGFRKVLSDKGYILSCDAISNCDTFATEGWFNSCSVCSVGYSWRYDVNSMGINFDYCMPNTFDANCMVASPTNIRTGKLINHPSANCRYCKKGYTFNNDGICERIDPLRCAVGNSVDLRNVLFVTTIQTSSYLNYAFMVEYLAPRGSGCSKCQDLFQAVKLTNNTSNIACTYSNYLALNKLSTSSNFVSHCRYYAADSAQIKCAQCEGSYVLSTDQRFCVLETSYPRCKLVDLVHNVCSVCEDNYVLANSTCQLKAIDKCATYSSANPRVMECTSCADTYKLASPYKCEPGAVPGCAQYNANGECLTCLSSYVARMKGLTVGLCLPLKDNLNCLYADNDLLSTGNKYKCTTCAAGYSFDATIQDIEKSFCLPLPTIDKCYTYNDATSLGTAVLECKQCYSGFYPSNGQCVAGPVVKNCYLHSGSAPGCAICASNYFISADKLSCQPFPTGVVDCIEYSSANVCTKCKSYLNLDKNACTSLADDQYSEKCEYYKNTTECIGCKSPYMLTTSTTGCQTMVAQNCLTATSPKTCATCSSGYVLKANTAGDGVDCVAYKKKNCVTVDQKTPYNCLQCNPGYYVQAGECVLVAKTIANCNVYASDKLCGECVYGYTLSGDAATCTLSSSLKYDVIEGCDIQQYNTQLKCAACEPGYYFMDGACMSCPTALMNSGCLACDPKATDKCLICKGSHYMDNTGGCLAIVTEPNIESVMLNKVVSLALLLLAALWL